MKERIFSMFCENLTNLYKDKISYELSNPKFLKKKKKSSVSDLILNMQGQLNKLSISHKNKSHICTDIKNTMHALSSRGYSAIAQATNLTNENILNIFFDAIEIVVKYENHATSCLSEEDRSKVIDAMATNTLSWWNSFLSSYTELCIIEKKEEIQDTVIDDPFQSAKISLSGIHFGRTFHIHVGDTNTGKTYSGMKALKEAKTGVYLSPLRLLALEKQDELNKAGCICSMITGEEESILPFSTHMSSTIELLDPTKEYDVAVIDECQMINDKNRGQFWTKAILEVRAHDIYLCTAPEALTLLKEILSQANEKFDIVHHERNTPLIVETKPYSIPSSIEKGDAIIVFSRKAVLTLANELRGYGYHVSTIYGALPYTTRKLQMDSFISGQTDVLVATDAIGMGLNLPIKRIIFSTIEKFDGESMRTLYQSEIKQIAGRAGRYGIFPKGYVAAMDTKTLGIIKESLQTATADIVNAYIGFSKNIVDIQDDLFYTVALWREIPTVNPFIKIDVSRILSREVYITEFADKLSKKEIYSLLNIPFNEKSKVVEELFLKYISFYISCRDYLKKYPISLEFPQLQGQGLLDHEDYYSCLDLYYSFSRNFGFAIDTKKLLFHKEKTAQVINKMLSSSNEQNPCRICGAPLPWNHKYTICDKCYFFRYSNVC